MMPEEKLSQEARPYPRRCVDCGQLAVQPKIIGYEAEIKHDGKLHRLHIPDLRIIFLNKS